jgi:cysteinyl-tRNA synthetase
VLWKAYDPERDGYIFWESPFGPGRPGWHIECSAMAMKLLGESIDIHVGGVDNIFPHHENEIAQSEAFTCKRFARLWMHSEHLLVDHKKMSKSLGNFYTLRDLIDKGYTGQEVRYMLLQTHYRSQLNFTLQGMDAVRHTLERLSDFIIRLRSIDDTQEPVKLPEDPLGRAKHAFDNCMCNDLNISGALAAIFDLVRTINSRCDAGLVRKKEAQQILEWLESIDQVLGVLPLAPQEVDIPQDLEEALANRQKARTEKNWAMADHYRDLITSRGYFIEDTPSGARLKKKD